MSLSRRTVAAVAAGIAALLVAPQALPASAASHAGPAATARAGQALIQGVVVDQFGTPVDDVEVKATKADGTAAASALTYASDRKNGPQHGYFYLEVGRGTYTVTFTRRGYKPLVLGDLTIAKARHKLSLGETEMERKLVESRTTATLAQKKLTTKQNGVVKVAVSPKDAKPTGTIEIREGRAVVGGGRLKASHKGEITIGLDRLAKGTHHLKAVYLGSTAVTGSSSATITLTVTKPRR